MKRYFLFFCRVKAIIHCLRSFHTDVHYKMKGKILKIKCKECNKVFYEGFETDIEKYHFENTIEKELDEQAK